MKRNLEFAVVFAMVLAAAFVSAVLVAQLRIPAVGVVKAMGLQVYADEACSVPLERIDWGLLMPGEAKVFRCFLKSISNVNISLALAVDNWQPSQAAEYIVLSWDCEGRVLQPSEVYAATFTLRVNPQVQGISAFSFDIAVSAVEAN